MKFTCLFSIAAVVVITLSCKTLDSQDRTLEEKRREMEMIVKKYKPMEGSGVTMDLDGFLKLLSNDQLVQHTDLAVFEECISGFVNTPNREAILMKDLGCDTLITQLRSRTGQDYVDFWKKNAAAIQQCNAIKQLHMDAFVEDALRPCRKWIEAVGRVDHAPSGKRKSQ